MINKQNISKILLVIVGLLLIITYFINSFNFKYYWHDEVVMLRNLSGYSQTELENYLGDGKPKNYRDIQKFQTLNPEKSWQDSLQSVIDLTPHKPPLYLALLRIWATIFGNSEWIFRSLSTVIYLITVVFFYQLVSHLFKSQIISFVATTFFSLSPHFLNYGLEVWEYGLFTLLTILSSLLFLKSLAKNNNSNKLWFGYSLSLICGFYTHLFFILIAIVHSLYFFCNKSLFAPQKKLYFWRVWLFSFILYLPWLVIVFMNRSDIYPWIRGKLNITKFLVRWLSYIPSLFSVTGNIFLSVLFFGILLFSLYYLINKTHRKTWLFIILLLAVPFFSLVIYDFIFNTRYSSVARFYVGTLIAIIISISFLIGNNLVSNNQLGKTVSYIAIFGLLINNIYLKILPLKMQTQFQGYGSQIINASFIVNQEEKPLVMGERWLDLLTFVHKADQKVDYLLINDVDGLDNWQFNQTYSDIFILSPSTSSQQKLKQKHFDMIPTDNPLLWQLNITLKK